MRAFLICKGRYYNITTITSCKNKTKKLFPSSQTLFPLKIHRRYYGYIYYNKKVCYVVGSMNSYYILGTKWKNPSKAFLFLVGDEKSFFFGKNTFNQVKKNCSTNKTLLSRVYKVSLKVTSQKLFV